MKPVRIQIHNIGKIEDLDIYFPKGASAVLGENGIGKSTTFTAVPVWILYGETKGNCPIDWMVKQGQDFGFGILDFEHKGQLWRVRRSRSTKGSGKSSLELFSADLPEDLQNTDDLAWNPETEQKISDTQAKIIELLDLDAKTFMASSMILQGRADEFTSRPAGERKQIFSSILGLDVYERACSIAKMEKQKKEQDISLLQEREKGFRESAQGVSLIEAELEDQYKTAERTEGEISSLETDVAKMEKDLSDSISVKAEYKALNEELSGIEREIQNITKKKEQAYEELSSVSAILARGDVIEQRTREYAELQAQRVDITVLEGQVKAQRAQAERDRDISCSLGKRLQGLSSEYTKTSNWIGSNGKSIRGASKRYQELGGILHDMDMAESKELNLKANLVMAEQEGKRTIDALGKTIANKKDNEAYCLAQMEILKDTDCIDIEQARKTPCKFLKQAFHMQDEILPELRKDIKNLEAAKTQEIQDLREKLKHIQSQIDDMKYSGEEHAKLREEYQVVREHSGMMNLLQERETRCGELEKEIRSLQEQITESTRVSDRSLQALNTLQAELERQYEIDRQIKALAYIVEDAKILANAEKTAQTAQALIDQLVDNEETKEGRISDITARKNDLIGLMPSESLQMDLNVKKGTLTSLRGSLATQREKMANMKAKIKSMQEDLQKAEKIRVDIQEISSEVAQWDLLQQAFSKKGIPALIIENALPELEILSNKAISEMTNGEHSLSFLTQRDNISNNGITETLDILIDAGEGSRPYETYSGGEQLRINFAIRFALAELMASRAGSKIEWLVADEGIGSQDEQHRDLVLRSLLNVSEKFAVTNVITHVDAAKDAFDQKIFFENTGSGVKVYLNE